MPADEQAKRRGRTPLRGDVAIVGMACLFPGAPDLDAYWRNILNKVDAISDPPDDAWDAGVFYDPDSRSNDRVYCKRGGFINDIAEFRPSDFGIMPVNVDGGEPDQWLALQVAHAALADAGYRDLPDEHVQTEVVLGKGTYINRGNMTVGYHGLIVEQVLQVLRRLHPDTTDTDLEAIKHELKAGLPPFSADTAPALIGNIIAGRIANRLDLMGPSFTVDAACASALLAIEIGVRDLLSHKCDMVLAGGVNVNVPIPTNILFCQLGALSRGEQIRPFDKDADGTILGEGLGIIVLKRLQDAEQDGNRIYAVIKGVGVASDGRALHVMAPRIEGEELALRRAYEMAELSPSSVGLVEAHGTATPVGDVVELQALGRVFGGRDGELPYCALGSVKSMIGHTMPAAGIAGVIKTALALYHRVLPPTLNCSEPNPALELEKTPFHVNTETRPWIHGAAAPRRAGVNAFGFGGINSHAVLEEYPGNETQNRGHLLDWDTEVFIIESDSRSGLMERAQRLETFLGGVGQVSCKDLAYTLNSGLQNEPCRLAVVAASGEDLAQKLTRARKRLADPECRQIKDSKGIYFFEQQLGRQGKLAFMFPGEGAQYVNMLADLCVYFPEVRTCFDLADSAFIDHPRGYLPSDFIFPRAMMSEREKAVIKNCLWEVDGAVESVLFANRAMWLLLTRLAIRPDVMVGHSAGDYSAMFASGVLDDKNEHNYVETIRSWNKTHLRLATEAPVDEVSLIAVAADSDTVTDVLDRISTDIHIAMENCRYQTVVIGSKQSAEEAVKMLRGRGIIYEYLPFDRPYHTPIFKAHAEGWGSKFFSTLPVSAPKTQIYSCTTAAPYPQDPDEIRDLFVAHWKQPVLFRQTIERMYADGVRVFVEVGARGNLTAFVDDILKRSPHLAMASNVPRRSGVTQLNHLVGILAAQGIGMGLDYLYAGRDPRRVSLEAGEANARRGPAPMTLTLGMPRLTVAPRQPEAVLAPPRPAAPALQAVETERPAAVVKRPAAGQDSQEPAVALPQSRSANAAVTMQEYVKNMGDFLDLQQQVMQAFFQRVGGPAPVASGALPAATDSAYPLLGTVTSVVPGRELVALRRLDLEHDLFLSEHALGGRVSAVDAALKPIIVVPLTVSMEILAEAGAALMTDRVLVAMRDVQARHWIRVDDEPVTLEISARRRADAADEVEVQIRNLARQPQQERVSVIPVVQAILVFAENYPPPPMATSTSTSVQLSDERPSRLRPADLYDGRVMFHGACFQGVSAISRCGQNGLSAQLRILPRNGLFRSDPAPNFVTDPVALDAAGQLVGFWTKEYLRRGYVVFPYRLEALHIYGANRPPGESVECGLRLELLGDERIRSDLEISAADGRLWMRLIGWEDRRFDLPERFHRFWTAPGETLLGEPWQTPAELLAAEGDFESCRLQAPFEPGNTLWMDLWASLILNRQERGVFQNLDESARRRQQWLLARAVAKDAVRAYLRNRFQRQSFPADITIEQDEGGWVVAAGPWARELSAPLRVSLAGCDGMAAAIVGQQHDGRRLGVAIDVATRQPEPAVDESIGGEQERRLLAAMPASARAEWLLRFRCAKQALAEALLGPRRGARPHEGVVISAADPNTGALSAMLQGELAAALPTLAGAEFAVYTARDGDYLVATTCCKRNIS